MLTHACRLPPSHDPAHRARREAQERRRVAAEAARKEADEKARGEAEAARVQKEEAEQAKLAAARRSLAETDAARAAEAERYRELQAKENATEPGNGAATVCTE